MEITKSVLSYEKISNEENLFPVIIVAAGSSVRMSGINKQFLKIRGIPVLARTILKFQNCDRIKSIIVVTKEEDITAVQKLCDEYNLTKVSDIVSGGTTRAESVKNGIAALTKGEKNVLIQDGARPFVTEKMIIDVCNSLKTADCAVVAQKSVDTVKLTDDESTVVDTLDRNKIYLAQTPQGVNLSKYRFALNSLNGKEFTDDSSIMETMGYKCVIVEGNSTNIKITAPCDIAIAEAIAGIEEEA